ncbi:MAG: M1 family aminopeptidase [Saprospiraceae bacterium]|nr:M1 family aminopeptidase [Saprospiraceae bacterium]
MKKIWLSTLFSLWAIMLFAQITDPLDDIAESEKAVWIRQHQAARDRDLQNSADNRSDIHYCRMNWTVDPAIKYIQGEVMTVFEPSEMVGSLEFDFSQVLTMDSILFHGQNLVFTQNGDVISVQFPAPLPAFLTDSLTFYYQGEPDSTGFGSFRVDTHADVPVLWTLSEPYGAMEWWPCKQALNDKIDSVDIFITHPSGYRAASIGLLQSETTANGWITAHWRHRYPVAAYLVAIGVTNYTVFTAPAPFGGDTTPILNYVYPESLADAQIGVDENVEVFQMFNQLFGQYPFHAEKYGHAQFSRSGGMEHQTMSFVSSFGYELLAHELAHQWFGDKITCASWEDIWLNEGFASYLTGLCYNFLRPQYWEIYKKDRIDKATLIPDGSVWVDDTTSVERVFNSRLSYAKGAMLLHMLRWKFGDPVFFTGVHNYVNDPALEYGYVKTSDFKTHMESVSGANLDEFFADWFYGKGFPSYQTSWSVILGNEVKITLQQTTSDPSVSFFEMPVAVKMSDGVQDTVLVLDHTFSGQVFTVALDFSPDSLVFDPELWLISRDNTVVSIIEDPLPALDIDLAPNPASSFFTIRLNAPNNEPAKMTFWASDGKLVKQGQLDIISGSNTIPVEIGELPAGRYLLRLESKSWQAERAVVVK